ncbi:hypothetical protein B0H17DRAFT_1126705 [Mycena rosella]|uniref:Uncharacterized protein n=1 Tax=Mycena rosella TaxID=1033263 RepID=A0AAD7GSH7_MYCRO|nr:hypothetical protein B0H17DRAFT_1126705 [Mycena rosella]
MQISRILSLSSARRLGSTRFLFSTPPGTPLIPRTKLPELPPPPLVSLFTSAVQSITQADIDHYVAPLYERNWRVFMEMPNLVLSDDSLERGARNVPMLGKKFWFLRGRAAATFLTDLVDFVGQEEHEPRITLFLGRMKQHVIVRMHTLRTTGETDDLDEANVRPGLSARDLRLALLLENHFQDKYVRSKQALPLLEMLRKPDVPDLTGIRIWHDSGIARATELLKADEDWAPSPLARSPLPPPPDLADADTVCTDADLDTFLRPLYIRGWHAAFLPILGKDKLYAQTLCLTGFFRFTSFAAAIAFVRAVVAFPWYKQDTAELHFLIDAQTVRAQLVYPPDHRALTLGNLRAALRIEQLFDAEFVGSARMSSVHPYRNVHQPASVQELREMRETPLRVFHLKHNSKMAWTARR